MCNELRHTQQYDAIYYATGQAIASLACTFPDSTETGITKRQKNNKTPISTFEIKKHKM